MKNFGELFQGYLKDEELLSQLGPGVVQAMRIDSKNRRMELDVAFDKIVKRASFLMWRESCKNPN